MNFLLLVHSWSALWSWEPGTQSRPSTWIPGTQLLEPLSLLPKVCLSRKLEPAALYGCKVLPGARRLRKGPPPLWYLIGRRGVPALREEQRCNCTWLLLCISQSHPHLIIFSLFPFLNTFLPQWNACVNVVTKTIGNQREILWIWGLNNWNSKDIDTGRESFLSACPPLLSQPIIK